jgi:hypothetical protein
MASSSALRRCPGRKVLMILDLLLLVDINSKIMTDDLGH